MKRTILDFAICALFATLICSSCAESEVIEVGVNSTETQLDGYQLWSDLALEGSVTGSAQGTTVELKSYSATEWSVDWEDRPSWCSFSPTSGKGNVLVKVTFLQNYDVAVQSATATVTIDGEESPINIDVEQLAAAPSIVVTPGDYEFGVAGETKPFSVVANRAWSASFVEFDNEGNAATPNWVSIEGESTGENNGSVTLKATDNSTNLYVHSVKLKITSTNADDNGELYQIIPLTQSTEFATPVLEVVQTYSVVFNWAAITGATKYIIQAKKSGSESFDIVNTSVNTTSYTVQESIYGDYVGDVEWTIYAADDTGNRSESDATYTLHSRYGGGSGTAVDPYTISAPWHFVNINKDLTAYYLQTAEVDLLSTAITPISTELSSTSYAGEFTGEYNGGGNTIKNITISESANSYVGLFANIGETGVVKNLKMDNVAVTAYAYFGGLAGSNAGTISGCEIVSGAVNSYLLGGSVTSTSDLNYGCFVGLNYGTIDGCINRADLNSGAALNSIYGNNAGGIVGYAGGGSVITDCVNYGTIMSNKYSGGIVGLISGTSATSGETALVSGCENRGSVNSNTAGNKGAGGIVGCTIKITLTLEKCANLGAVYGTGGMGGILGAVGNSVNITNISDCSNIAAIQSTGTNATNEAVSGIVGKSLASSTANINIENCYSTGTLTAGSGITIGAIIGRSAGTIAAVTSCYALSGTDTGQNSLTNISGITAITEIDKSETDLKTAATYVGWDDDTWYLVDGFYPTLK